MAVLELKNVCCGYGGKNVVNGISLTLRPGEIISLAGPNGCGKTTLIRAACGMLPISSGEIYINGKAVSSFSSKERAGLTAMLSQTGTGGDYSDYTVMETVIMGRYAHYSKGLFPEASAKDKAIAENCIARIGLSELKDRLITELSGGQLQRVFLARAFAQEPEIIFLDEPANHLDLKHQSELYDILKNWVAEGRSVVGVFHDLGFAAAVSDRMMLMHDGKSAFCGTPQEAVNSPKLNEVFDTDVKAYMKSISGIWQ